MAKGTLGSFVGTVTPGVNMIDLFKDQQGDKRLSRKWPTSIPFAIQKMAINGEPGTSFKVNDAQIVLPSTGVFELSYGLCDIDSLVFDEAVDVNIVYLY